MPGVSWKTTRTPCQGLCSFTLRTQFSKSRKRVLHLTVRALSSEAYKRKAAERAVDAFVKDGSVVGLGYGTMVVYAIEVLGQRIKEGILRDVVCLSASDMASAEAAVQGVPLEDMNRGELLADVTFLEADEVDFTDERPSLITGRAPAGPSRQQPQLLALRTLTLRSRECVGLLADAQMVVKQLGGNLPVTISAENWESTAEEIDDIFIGDAEIWRRSQDEAADPRGYPDPYFSPEGHNILDIRFLSTLRLYGKHVSYQQIAHEIEKVDGVVTHGLFLDTLTAAVIAGPEAKILEKVMNGY